VRLTGCALGCGYCDSVYAFYGGKSLSISAILAEVASYAPHYVTVTGGEPLVQKECLTLLRLLCDAGYSVSLETSGALDVSKVDARVSRILDIKTPGSGEAEKNQWSNLDHLTRHDEVKFVLCDETDYQWAVEAIHERKLNLICPILFSPVYDKLDPATLAEWVLRDRLPVRVQIQLHKLLWGEGPGR
jgi:7-carboxy-7-deazaguanine synthase